MGSTQKGVEDLKPWQAANDGRGWIRRAPEPLLTYTRTWASCQVDGFRCFLIATRDLAGVRNLHFLLVEASTVLYLPGRKLVQGACPVTGCKRDVTR